MNWSASISLTNQQQQKGTWSESDRVSNKRDRTGTISLTPESKSTTWTPPKKHVHLSTTTYSVTPCWWTKMRVPFTAVWQENFLSNRSKDICMSLFATSILLTLLLCDPWKTEQMSAWSKHSKTSINIWTHAGANPNCTCLTTNAAEQYKPTLKRKMCGSN